MKYISRNEAVLLLQDGTAFHGKAVGKIGTTTGEIAFNTGMTGYQEIFTDPSYLGQILVMTPSHIGNYGACELDVESDSVKIAGLVCKKFSEIYSRKLAGQSLQDYFEENEVVGISDIDTRALVRHIRDKGAMNAIISSDVTDVEQLKAQLDSVPSMEGLELSSRVSTKEPYFLGDEANAEYKVAVLDLGAKQNILRCLIERGCYLKVFPYDTSFDEMNEWNPDGYMLTNGPGDPASMPTVIENVKTIIANNKPTFGICLGHQMMSLAAGIQTHKMHNGHRGVNHPVLNLKTGKGEITSQNHGFVADMEAALASTEIEVTHKHLNDQTLAGIRYVNKPAFSVQYHPESSAGPNDSRYLFDDFIQLMKENK
ncbi:MAG: carbamoyl phosphate synthase small subunit [Crocinitomicaceae bacterium]|nr:carbamoyl phosphate synthase small subunit [Crocinitomicaceae bacterium]|tara:strand:+ start:401 stop:1510 length:1110 start_codon:yes stop_codon:yes gene_type:complete